MKIPILTAASRLAELSLRLALFCFLLSSLALAADPRPDDCLPTHCGNGVNVSYPFWIDVLQPPHCGFPSFKLICREDFPVIRIFEDDYRVQNISYRNESFVVSSVGLLNDSCYVPPDNLSLNATPFTIVPGQSSLSFLLHCEENSAPPGYVAIDCPNGPSFVGRDPVNASTTVCESAISFPTVGLGEAGLEKYEDVLDILKLGFLLRWRAVNCSECLESGGRCRYNTTASRFSCLCDDKFHATSCKRPGKKKMNIVIGVCAGIGGVLLASFICFLFFRWKIRKVRSKSSDLLFRSPSLESSFKKDPEGGSVQRGTQFFRYEELHEATNGFISSNELGDGGFGTVYKGKLRDGRIVAVKRLYENNFKRVEQFMNEVEILNRLRHNNLVSLYGCTSRHSRELLLVYEFVPNGTVADHLHGHLAHLGVLSWPLRLRIALETATALAYLHAVEPQIIHRDVKTNNILLDANFHVKVADFGLSRLFPMDATHVSTAPQGTPGYVDPEYHQCYHLTDKSDVYSFGVVLVELISSKPAVDITRRRNEINLSSMAISRIQSGALEELVDPALGFQTDLEVRRMIKMVAELAFRCLQGEKEMRPAMDEVVEVLHVVEGGDEHAEEKRTGEMEPTKTKTDEMRLLNKMDEPPSPDTVMHQWSSRATTPYASG